MSLTTAHSIISAIDDTEMGLQCAKPGAPPPGLCVTADKHREISARLARAYRLESAAAAMVKATAVPGPDAQAAMAQVSGLLAEVMQLLPDGAQKASLTKRLEAAR